MISIQLKTKRKYLHRNDIEAVWCNILMKKKKSHSAKCTYDPLGNVDKLFEFLSHWMLSSNKKIGIRLNGLFVKL